MISEVIAVLGIPIDNLTVDETVERTFSLIDACGRDRRPRRTIIIDINFVVSTLTGRLSRTRHLELLDIPRQADLVMAGGMPLAILSRLLGSPLMGEGISGTEFVTGLAETAAQKGKSIGILGGREGVAEQVAGLLREKHPGLRISGIDLPFTRIQGENTAAADETARLVFDEINEARVDILLVIFGNPDQQIWLNHNRNRLRVPVSVDIGTTLEFIRGSEYRGPAWFEEAGLAWLFRIVQTPGRLMKKDFAGFVKLGLMVLPAVFYYRYRRLCCRLFGSKGVLSDYETQHKVLPALGYLNVITLPVRLDLVALDHVSEEVARACAGASNIALDFSQVYFVDSTGLGFLIRTLRRLEREGNELYLVRVSPKVRHFFELNRVWDIFRDRTWGRVDEVLTQLDEKEKTLPFYYVMTNKSGLTLLDLYGRLDAQQLSCVDVNGLLSAVSGRNCILNLARLSFVDSAGLLFFLKIQKNLASMGKKCVLCSLTDNLRQSFSITRLDHLFRIAPDIGSAQQILEEPS